MLAFAAVFVVFLILVFAEYLSRYKGVHSELTRKIVHILVGVFVAFWPFFLSWRTIQLLSVGFLLVVVGSIKLNIFASIHAVKRKANGEVLFAIAIGLLALIATHPWVFTTGMLFLSVADGLAAVAGLAWGENSQYKVFGHTKSLVGTLTFFFVSVIIMICFAGFGHLAYSATMIVWLPALAAIAENFAVNGTDNLVIPLLVGLVLTSSL